MYLVIDGYLVGSLKTVSLEVICCPAIAVFFGLKKRLESPEFILDLCLMYDVLQEHSMLSNELQSRTITLPKAEQSIKRTTRIIEIFNARTRRIYTNNIKS